MRDQSLLIPLSQHSVWHQKWTEQRFVPRRQKASVTLLWELRNKNSTLKGKACHLKGEWYILVSDEISVFTYKCAGLCMCLGR